ncbi:MAG TPA: hypothetical protein VN380_19205 [Thermoanaerobaculia bacterium]|jgi:hypothetical protein|nr:hypothetical protein [Thermoanaerobaculia bacterium]
MRIATCFLVIGLGVSGQNAVGETSHYSKHRTDTLPCSDLPRKAEELAALRSAISKARAAIATIDFGKIAISYSQGAAMMTAIKADQDELSYADAFAARAEAQPTLLYYWDAYSEAIDAKKAVEGANWTLRFAIVNNDEASTVRIKRWRDDLDDAAHDLDEARQSAGKFLRHVLESVDKCAFGVVYQQKRSARANTP